MYVEILFWWWASGKLVSIIIISIVIQLFVFLLLFNIKLFKPSNQRSEMMRSSLCLEPFQFDCTNYLRPGLMFWSYLHLYHIFCASASILQILRFVISFQLNAKRPILNICFHVKNNLLTIHDNVPLRSVMIISYHPDETCKTHCLGTR